MQERTSYSKPEPKVKTGNLGLNLSSLAGILHSAIIWLNWVLPYWLIVEGYIALCLCA